MRGARQLMLALIAAIAAGPATAGVVYTPAANFEKDGVLRRSDLLLSNTDASQMRAATLRFITEGAAGTELRDGADPVLWTGPAGSAVRRVPADVLPAGRAGMLEISPGSGSIVVGARLVYEMPGVYSQSVDVPAIAASSLLDADSLAYLQGLESDSGAGVLTDLAIFNLGTSTATCRIDVTSPAGEALVVGQELGIPAVSSVFRADLFGKGGFEIDAPAGSWASVGCDEPFWTLAIRHDTVDGSVRALLPTSALADSDLEKAGGAGGGELEQVGESQQANAVGEFGFEMPGLFLTCAPDNKFWRTNLFDERVVDRTFRQIVVDFDVYHHSWNPPKSTHIYMWLQNGPSWSRSLMGYLIASRKKGQMKFQVKYGNKQQVKAGPSGRPGGTYHVHYEWNGATRKVSFQLTTPEGAMVAQKALPLNKRNFTVTGMFLGLGSWPTGHGPEALQYDWTYSNLVVNYVE